MKIDFEPEIAFEPEPEAIQFEPEEQLETNELSATGNAFLRGIERTKQQAAATGLNAAAAASEELVRKRQELAQFDRDFPAAQDFNLQRKRDTLLGQIAGLENESAQRASYVPELSQSIQASEQRIGQLPRSPALKEFQEGDWWEAWKRNPVEITAGIIAESLPQMAPALVGTATTGPVGGAAITAVTSGGTEFASALLQSAQEAGVNLQDKKAVEEFFSNPEKLREAREYAVKRGVPIALFDATSAGLAGRIVKPFIGQGVGKVAAASAAEVGVQAAAGAAGEATAQLASEGQITSGRDIFAESISEVASAPTEVIGNVRSGDLAQRTAEAQQRETQPVKVQFTEHGTVVVNGTEHAVQDDVLKPVAPGSTKQKAIESLVGKPDEIPTESASESTEDATEQVEPVDTVEQETEATPEPTATEEPLATEEPSPEPTAAQPAEAAEVLPDSPVVEPSAEPTAEPSSPVEPPPLPENVTSIKNAVVDQERARRGLPPATPAARKEFGRSWDAAVQRVANDPDAGRRLVGELTQNPRPLNDEENALLLYRQVEAQNEFASAQEALAAAQDDAQQADASARVNRASDELLAIYNAGRAAGTEQGRGLATRKMLANEDFTLAKMVTMRRAANDGKPLTAQQNAEIIALNKRIQDTEKKLSEYEEREKIAQAKEEFQRLINESRKEARQTAKQGKGLTDFLDDQAQKAKDRIIARRGRLQTTVDPLNVAGLVDEAIIGASYIAKGIRTFAEWSTRMLSDFGDRIQPYLQDLFERSKQYHDASTGMFSAKPRKSAIEKARENAASGNAIDAAIVYDLAREKVRSGMNDLEPVISAVTRDLLPIYPGITEREVRDAFSGYGKVSVPSKEEDLVKLRELRRLGQLTSAIEDAQRKVAPLKSGPQRDKATQKIREMQKELQRVMREQGIETASPEQQLASANQARATALRNQIEDLDKQLRTGEKKPKRPGVPDSSEVERLRSERDSMKRLLDEIEESERVKPSPEEAQLKRDKAAIQRRTKELRDRIARGDYAPRPKKTPLMDSEKAALLQENQKAKEEFWRGLMEEKLRNRSTREKIIGGAGEVLNTSRALLTSFDVSAVLRQGGFIAFGNPVRAASSIGPMFRALVSERAAFRVDQEIRARASYPKMQQAKLYLADESVTSLSKAEEEYMSRWVRKIPVIKQIVGASQRAYVTFLNKLRADTFDAMSASLAKNGTPTAEESRALASFINIATGRGDLGKFNQAGTLLSTVFFAPRYVASRFQLLLGKPLYGGTARTRKLVAQEYAKMLIGASLIYALAISAGADVEDDPTSSDFGKLRFGNTRIDPMFGLIQSTVLLSRIGKSIRNFFTQTKAKKPQYGSGSEVLFRFLRSKLSPVAGSVVNMAEGRNVVGESVTPGSVATNLVTPIAMQDIANVMQEQGVPRGAAISILSLFGMGVQNYDRKK